MKKIDNKQIKSNELFQSKNNSKMSIDIARKDIEKSININNSNDTEAYYSSRYGWTLRKVIS